MKERLCTEAEVTDLRNMVRRKGATDGQLGAILGVSRQHINQMLNHKTPMRVLYRYAFIGALLELRRSKA